MANIVFFYNNLWNQFTLENSSAHPNFPVLNTQLRDINKPWISRHGPGSHWGAFAIEGGDNDRLDFRDNGGTVRAAELSEAIFNADELASHIKTKMEATPTSDTFTVEYLESGGNANKFKITDNVGNFELLCNTGVNKSRSVFPTIGYSEASDKTGAAFYIADNIRIHRYEYLMMKTAANQSIKGAFLGGHNIRSSGVLKLKSSNNDFASVSDEWSFTWNENLMAMVFPSPESYQDWLFHIEDVDNPELFVKAGVAFLGPGFQPARNVISKSRVTRTVDPSIIKQSEGGQESTIQLEDYDVWQYRFGVKGSSEITAFKSMFKTVKKSKPLFICEDPDNPSATTYYCRFEDWEWTPIKESADYWELTLQVKELV